MTYNGLDIGGNLYGPPMRYLILGSIVLSQMGFVAAYTIFVSQNLQVGSVVASVYLLIYLYGQAFVMGITHCLKFIPTQYFILMQLIIFLPLALVRDIAKLSSAALVADAFILVGLIYIFGNEFIILAQDGVADVKLFNSKDFPLFIG